MLNTGIYNYFLVRLQDWYVRYGFRGDDTEMQTDYLAGFACDIEYLGSLPLPIKSDLDVGSGEGTKKIGISRLATCKFQKQMITIKVQPETYLTSQRKSIVNVKEQQVALICRKELVAAKKLLAS